MLAVFLLLLVEIFATSFHKHILLVTREGCPYSMRARKLLNDKGYDYADINVTEVGFDVLKVLKETSYTYPTIYINSEFIGGATELEKLLEYGEIDSSY